MGGIEAEPPIVGAPRPNEPVLRKGRGCDANDPGPTRVHALRPGAILQKLEAAARHGKRDPLRHGRAIGIEPEDASRRQSAAKGSDQPRGVKAYLMKATLRDRACSPRKSS